MQRVETGYVADFEARNGKPYAGTGNKAIGVDWLRQESFALKPLIFPRQVPFDFGPTETDGNG